MTVTNKPRRMARPTLDADGAGGTESEGLAATASIVAIEKRLTKQDLVLGLLQREGGVSLAAIVEATGWLPHSARAALTGLRKKGHDISRSKIDGETRYAVRPAIAQ